MPRLSLKSLVGAFAVVGSLMCGPAHAAIDIIYDSEGFEAPRFDAVVQPELFGQDDGNIYTGDPWTQDNPATIFDANIQTSVVKTGAQALQIDRQANEDTRFVMVTPIGPNFPNDRIFIDAFMKVEFSTPALAFGPYFGIEASDYNGPPFASEPRLGLFYVDATERSLLVGTLGTLADTGVDIDDDWHFYRMILNYTTKTYELYVDDMITPVVTVAFLNPALNTFTEVDLASVADESFPNLTGTAYFDDLVVYQVPEPATLSAGMMLAVTLMLRRRRRQA